MEEEQLRASVPPPEGSHPPDHSPASEPELDPAASPAPIDTGVAGASARAEYERRQANRRARNQRKYGRALAGAIELLRDPPQHEQAWAKGASGEEGLAKLLAARCSDLVVVLHDRQIPGSRANIDHIATCPTGVWVIDPKKYQGKIVVSRPLFRAKKLVIAGRDRTKLVTGVKWQIEVVTETLRDAHPHVPVRGALCFPGGDMPLRGLPDFDGIKLIWPKRLAKTLNRSGPLDAATIDGVARLLAERLPAHR